MRRPILATTIWRNTGVHIGETRHFPRKTGRFAPARINVSAKMLKPAAIQDLERRKIHCCESLKSAIIADRQTIGMQERHITLASAKARKIQELREARGYSVEDVAHRMGETPERVRALEASDEDPDEGVLSQYLDTLGMSQDEKRKVWDEEKHA